MKSLLIAAMAMMVPAVAMAETLIPGEQHEPPVYLDETSTWVNTQTNREGYRLNGYLKVLGITSEKDRVRIEWKQGGKLLATMKCNPEFSNVNHSFEGRCGYSGEKLITGVGAIDADVIYSDDQTEKEYLVRTLHVNVAKWNDIGKDRTWQVLQDDLLAGAWATEREFHDVPQPVFVFWIERNDAGAASLRCTVDGKKIDDLEVDLQNQKDEEIDANHVTEKFQHHMHWIHVAMDLSNVGIGDEATHKNGYAKYWLGQMPGKWACKLRGGSDGKTFRELAFDVKDGRIQQDEMNTGKGAIRTAPGVAMIDMRIPKDSTYDERVRPDAMKKSFGYGLKWPDHPKVKEIHASFPAASGFPDP